jgi:hypothetical protein
MIVLSNLASAALNLIIIVMAVQYVCYVISRIHVYWIQAKRINLKNPKYSLEDLDRIYKAKEKRRQKE